MLLPKKITLSVFTDGGALNNPGPAAVGIVVKKKGKTIKKLAKYIGKTTNNVAEYTAVIEALKWLKENQSSIFKNQSSINFFLDSKLVVNQLNGLFKIKDWKLRNLVIKVRGLEREAGGNIFYCHIPREKNVEADSLVKSVLAKR